MNEECEYCKDDCSFKCETKRMCECHWTRDDWKAHYGDLDRHDL